MASAIAGHTGKKYTETSVNWRHKVAAEAENERGRS